MVFLHFPFMSFYFMVSSQADRCLTGQLQSWLASTLERHLRAAQLEPSKASRLYDACGWLLWACERPSADMLREAMALGGHVELRKALGDLEDGTRRC